MADAIRVLIADDHPTLREGLRAILDTQDDFEVIGEAATGNEAVDRAAALRPDVVLMDLEMPELDGVEATRRLRERLPDINVIVFTAFDTDDRIIGAVEAGARGYLLKGAPREEIFRAIRVAREGGTLLQPAIASKLLRHVASPRSNHGPDSLSERELEVLSLLVDGLTNKEIAFRLVVSERTVKFHVASILGKLDVPNRAAAVRVALEQRLVHR
jgi:NarL family two-component system response regulator LiaR